MAALIKIGFNRTMLRYFYIFLFFSSFTNNTAFAQDVEPWVFVKEDHGIRVFTNKSPESPVKEVKVEMLMHTTLSALIALIKDVKNQHKWVYANKTADILKSVNNYSWVFYGQSEAPWPVSDRDMVALTSLHQDSVTKVVTSVSVGSPDFIPEVENFVRVPHLNSSWTFTPKGSGNVLVEFVLKIDLGGNIPCWLVNLAIAKGPHSTIFNMAHELEKPEYKNAHITYIKE